MPNARRVIFSTYVTPTQSVEMEETSIRKTHFQNISNAPYGSMGGRGIATINATQWGDGWTSFSHANSSWDDADDNWNASDAIWSGYLELTASGHLLSRDSSDLAFLYIKNIYGSKMTVSLNGQVGDYYLVIPEGGSLHLQGDGTNLECNEVWIKSSGKTRVEWIIAKE